MPTISTPCVKICVIDEATSLCLGCGRTRDEITRWMRFTEEQRRAIMAELGLRLAELSEALNARDERCPG